MIAAYRKIEIETYKRREQLMKPVVQSLQRRQTEENLSKFD